MQQTTMRLPWVHGRLFVFGNEKKSLEADTSKDFFSWSE
jgi:hypothetical protein